MLDGNGRYRFKMNDPVNDKRELDARPDIVYITYSDDITVEHINFKSSAFGRLCRFPARMCSCAG